MTGSYNHFNEVAQQLYDALGDVVSKTAFDIQATAASLAPVDTGFLKNSIYVETYTQSTYGHSGPGGFGQNLLDAIPSPPNKFTAYIAVGAEYGLYQELGTVHQPAQPYLAPATDLAEQPFEQAVAAIESKMRSI